MDAFALQQLFDQALRQHQAGRLSEAQRLYEQILAQAPGHVDSLHLLGVLSGQCGRHEEAVDLIRRAIARRPDFPQAYSNLGNALRRGGKSDEAIEAYRRAIGLSPEYAEAFSNLGNALRDMGRREEAIAAYRQAVALRPTFAEAFSNLGDVLKDAGRSDEAIEVCERAVLLSPNLAEAHNNLGNALRIKTRLDEAVDAYQRAIALNPNLPEAHNNLGNALKDRGQLDEAIAEYRKAIALRPGYAQGHSNLVFTMQYHPDYDERAIAEELARWNERHAAPLRKFVPKHTNDADADRRLRIGYVSPDFRDHVVGRNLAPLFANHDRGAFEIFCYSHVARPDEMTERFRQHADGWREIGGMSDEQVARQILQDRIDILVDLTMHMGDSRLAVFARKPAPVQVTCFAYPGSTGIEAIDYRLTDPYLDLPESAGEIYSEKSVRLAETFWCYDPSVGSGGESIDVGLLPALRNGYVTFGCLNNFCKINDRTLELWAGVLGAVADARLLVLSPVGWAREKLLRKLERVGIAAARVEVSGGLPRNKYLGLYHRIDIGLDTIPYNGHTTSLDSFWMGVPVVTLVGSTVVGRAGWSQLSNLGLPELAAKTPVEFTQIASALAADIPRLSELRAGLRERMKRSPLMDAPRFARNIESAYRGMWRKWCEAMR